VNPGNIPRIWAGRLGSRRRLARSSRSRGRLAATGVVFGLFPCPWRRRAPILNLALKESSSRSGSGFRQNKARSILVVAEVALALVLLVGASLLIRSFIALRA
jgi:hypothetical protein